MELTSAVRTGSMRFGQWACVLVKPSLSPSRDPISAHATLIKTALHASGDFRRVFRGAPFCTARHTYRIHWWCFDVHGLLSPRDVLRIRVYNRPLCAAMLWHSTVKYRTSRKRLYFIVRPIIISHKSNNSVIIVYRY